MAFTLTPTLVTDGFDIDGGQINPTLPGTVEVNTSTFGSSQVNPTLPGTTEVNTSTFGSSQVNPTLPGTTEVNTSTFGSSQVNPTLPGTTEVNTSTFGSSQVNPTLPGTVEAGLNSFGSSQVNPTLPGTVEVNVSTFGSHGVNTALIQATLVDPDNLFPGGHQVNVSNPATTLVNVNQIGRLADGNLYWAVCTIPAGQVDADMTRMPVLLTDANLPADMLDTLSGKAIESGAGSLRAYLGSDHTNLSTRFALEVVSCVPDSGGPSGYPEIWASFPSLVASTGGSFIVTWGGGGSQPAVGAQYGRNEVWQDYTAVWHMSDDPSGGSLTDSTGNGNTGTPQGGMDGSDLVAGQWGTAWDFDGSDDNVNCGNVIDFGGDITVMCWAKLAGAAPTGLHMMAGEYGWGKAGAHLYADDSTGPRGLGLGIGDGANNQGGTSATRTLANLGQWYHCVGTATVNSISVFLDGSDETVDTSTGAMATPSNDFRIGTGADVTSRYINGALDEVRVAAVNFSAGQVSTHYNAQSAPATFAPFGSTAQALYGAVQTTLPATTLVNVNRLGPLADGNLYYAVCTIPAGQVDADMTRMPVLLTDANLPADMLDTLSGKAIESGAGSLRAYLGSDHTDLSTRFALEVVSCIPGSGGPSGYPEVWASFPSLIASTGGSFIVTWGGGGSQPATGAQYGRDEVWQDYAAVWHMSDDPSGGSLTDSTGNGNTGTPQGGMDGSDLVAGPWGSAWDITGTQHVTVATDSSLDLGTNPISVQMWVNPPSVLAVHHLINRRQDAPPYKGWALMWLESLNVYQATWWSVAGNADARTPAAIGPTASQWNFITFDKATTAFECTIDGSLDGTTGLVNDSPADYAETLDIAHYYDAANGHTYSPGTYSEVRIRVGTQSDYSTEYNAQSAPATFAPFGGVTKALSGVVQTTLPATLLDDSTDTFPVGQINVSLGDLKWGGTAIIDEGHVDPEVRSGGWATETDFGENTIGPWLLGATLLDQPDWFGTHTVDFTLGGGRVLPNWIPAVHQRWRIG